MKKQRLQWILLGPAMQDMDDDDNDNEDDEDIHDDYVLIRQIYYYFNNSCLNRWNRL